MGNLIFIRFGNGTAKYTSDFQVEIEGFLWPRELKALWEIIGIFKAENKESNRTRGDKKQTQAR